MANSLTNNPFNIDTVGGICTAAIIIKGIKVVPNNTTWSVILKNKAGNIVYQDNNNAGGDVLPCPFYSEGLVVDTLTNITRVLIYT